MPFIIMGALYGIYLLLSMAVGFVADHWIEILIVVLAVAGLFAFQYWRDHHRPTEWQRYMRARRSMNRRVRQFHRDINLLKRRMSQ